jgi:undecaprenyl-diphosphatase
MKEGFDRMSDKTMEWIEALILGAVQGLTEFLPISSDGHLTIVQQAFAKVSGHGRTGAENLFFDVMLHLGTLAAIVLYYRAVVKTGAAGLLGSTEVPPAYRRPAVIRTAFLAIVATLPLVPLKLFLKDWIDKAFESTAAAGIGFLITAAVLLLTVRLRGGEKGPDRTTWLDALLIGIAQMFAPLPGVSRSGLTVASALGLGLSRSWAVGFSLLIAVPAILGAAFFELKKLDPRTLDPDRVAQTVSAAILAGLIGYGAIIWLVKIVRSGRLWYFSVYLIVLGTAVLAAVAVSGGSPDVRHSKAMDRPTRLGAPGTGAGRDARGGAVGPLDRPLSARPRAVDPGAGEAQPGGAGSARLVLARPLAGGA